MAFQADKDLQARSRAKTRAMTAAVPVSKCKVVGWEAIAGRESLKASSWAEAAGRSICIGATAVCLLLDWRGYAAEVGRQKP